MDNTTAIKPTVLVTGSSGLIGQRICKRLAKNYRVVGLDVKSPENELDGVAFIECDFTKGPSVKDAIRQVRQDHGDHLASVVHLAAYYDFAGEPSPLYDELTVEGTRRLLEQLHTLTRVEQFIFSSSLLVMKPCDVGEKLTEICPMEGVWDYPASKIKAEKAIRSTRGNIPAVILRIAGVYDERGHSIPITQNIRRIAEKEFESYFFPGNADRGQAFVHLDDVVSAFEKTIERRHDLDTLEVFLIAEDECLSYDQLQDIIGEHLHGVDDWPTIRIPKFVAKAGAWAKDKLASSEEDRPFIKPWMVDLADAHYPVDSSLAAKRLGWHAEHKLSRTLPVMLANLQADPARWYRENKLPLPDEKKLEAIQL
jgi:nucleoside-diphosphate-sugar epimerase